MLYNNRFKFNMPPPLIIAPSTSSNLSFIPCDSNSLGSAGHGEVNNKAFAADRGNEFSVSSQINADSGSSGTYIAVRNTNNITDLQMCTPPSRISSLALPSGHSLRAYIFSDLKNSLLSIRIQDHIFKINCRIHYRWKNNIRRPT